MSENKSACECTFDCESTDCAYNFNNTCRFARVKERAPRITENDGCTDFVIVNSYNTK